MGFLGTLILLSAIILIGCIKFGLTRKIDNAEGEGFIIFKKHPVITANQKTCDCTAMISCACCERVKIFYTNQEKQLCFNMIYQRNGLNLDISLDSLIIKSITVANYKPFQMCSSVPRLPFTTICVYIQELKQYERSITVCPRLEVTSKKESWQIRFSCGSISTQLQPSTATPPTEATTPMTQPTAVKAQMVTGGPMTNPMGHQVMMNAKPPETQGVMGQMNSNVPMAGMFMGQGQMSGNEPMAGVSMGQGQMNGNEPMAGVPMGPFPGVPQTMQMPAQAIMPQITVKGQMPEMSMVAQMGQMPSMQQQMMQVPSKVTMSAMPGISVMGQAPGMVGPMSVPGAVIGQIPGVLMITSPMDQMPNMQMAQVPVRITLGQASSISMMGQTPGSTNIMSQMPPKATTTSLMPGSPGTEQVSGVSVMGQVPGNSAMVQVTGTAMVGKMPGVTMMEQVPNGAPANLSSMVQQASADKPLMSPLRKLSGIVEQLLKIPNFEQMFGAVSEEVTEQTVKRQISGPLATSENSNVSLAGESFNLPLLVPTTEKTNAISAINEEIRNSTEVPEEIKVKQKSKGPTKLIPVYDTSTENTLLQSMDKPVSFKPKVKSNATTLHTQNLSDDLSQIVTAASDDKNLTAVHIGTSNVSRRIGIKRLKRKTRNIDVFDILHQSNRCERAYKICITKSKNMIISRIRNPQTIEKCYYKSSRITFGLPEDTCDQVDLNDGVEATSVKPTITTTEDPLGAIVIHDESMEGSDFYPQTNQHESPMIIQGPNIFLDQSPPVPALIDHRGVRKQSLKSSETYRDTLIFKGNSNSSKK